MSRVPIPEISVTGIIPFDPTHVPFDAWKRYLSLPLVESQINGGSESLRFVFLPERDALLLGGPLAAEIGPKLAMHFFSLDDSQQLKQFAATAQDTKVLDKEMYLVVPRGLWPVAAHLLAAHHVSLALPEPQQLPPQTSIYRKGVIQRALHAMRRMPYGRFVSRDPLRDVPRVALGAARQWDRPIAVVARSKQTLNLLRQRFQTRWRESGSPDLQVTVEFYIANDLYRAADEGRFEYGDAIILVAEAKSVANHSVARVLGRLPTARIYGFEKLCENVNSPFENTRMACFFGVHRQTLFGPVHYLRQKLNFGDQQGASKSTYETKKSEIWESSVRNQYIAQLARYLAGEDVSPPRPLEAKVRQLRDPHRNSKIAILVENTVHRTALLSLLTAPTENSSPRSEISILTISDPPLTAAANDFDVLLRADALPGNPEFLLKLIGGARRPLTIIDLCDQHPASLGHFVAQRRNAVRNSNFVAYPPERAVTDYYLTALKRNHP